MHARIRFALLAAATAAATLVSAQGFPSRPITIVVPFPPGAGTDVMARVLAPKLAASFGQPVVIENRSGATGNIGAQAVAQAAPDGHTILYTSASIALSNSAPGRGFDPERSLEPVTVTLSIPQVLVVNPAVGARDLRELLALARAKPGTMSFGSGGNGSSLHLPMELLKLRTAVDVMHVPYRGAAPAQLAVMSGEVQMAFLTPPLVKVNRDAGRLRPIAVAARDRSPVLPEVPTFGEAGLADFEALQWHAMFLPAKTPAAVVQRWHREIAAALATPEVKQQMETDGASAIGSTPREAAAFVREERVRWGEVVKRAHLTFD
jgi:tripartite-type tricarboxylate transporter receptor subunit TctC